MTAVAFAIAMLTCAAFSWWGAQPARWRPPSLRPGDQLLEATMRTSDGLDTHIVVHCRYEPRTGERVLSGYSAPLLPDCLLKVKF